MKGVDNIFQMLPMIIWAGNLALVLVLGLVSLLCSFWLRCKIDVATKYQKLKWRSQWDDEWACWLVCVLFIEGLLGFIVFGILTRLSVEGLLLPILIALGSILLLLYAPRFAIDLIKGLKVNKKGDLERIDKLEKELQSLKEKASK